MEFTDLPDLAAARVGGRAVLANDEFFAPKRNLLLPGRGIFVPGKFQLGAAPTLSRRSSTSR